MRSSSLVSVCALALVVACCGALSVSAWDYPILLSAPWTPFYPNGSVNYDIIDAQIAMHKKNGVTVVWVSGGMSQFDQLTIDERMNIAKAYLHAIRKQGLYYILHVGHQTIPYAMELAAFAETLGVDAIAVEPPFAPERIGTIQELVQILALIAAQAPNTPFYYYHIPGTTGYYYNMTTLLTLSQGGVIPTMSGVKYVNDDLEDYYGCLQLKCDYNKGCIDGKYNVLWADNPKIQSLPYGAKAFVLAENYWAPYMKKVYDAWVSGNQTLAQEHQDYYNQLMACELDGKSVMRAMGIDLGPPRLPQFPVDPATYVTQCECLSNLDFFDALNLTPNCQPPM